MLPTVIPPELKHNSPGNRETQASNLEA